MKSSYNELGKFIREVNVRNSNLTIINLLGVSMEKIFIPSVANLNGVDLSVYKVLRKDQLACKLMSVGRDEKLPVDLYKNETPAIVSSAYYVFEPKDKKVLLPEFLMMWLCRPENDRYIGFISGGDVRGGISWETFCSLPIRVPKIEKQREIVKEYYVIQNQIEINNKLIQKLEDAADAIYKQRFVEEMNDSFQPKTLNDLCSLITDGKHGDCDDEGNSGYYFLSAKDLRNNSLIFNGARQITKKDFDETHRRTNLEPGDICMVNTGATIGRMSIAPDNPLTFKSTFQKSVAILKPRKLVATSYFLYCLLRNNIKEITELGSGTSQANLLLGDLKKYVVKYPNYQRIIDFEGIVSPVFKMRTIKVEENIRLNQLKDLLLSKLATVD